MFTAWKKDQPLPLGTQPGNERALANNRLLRDIAFERQRYPSVFPPLEAEIVAELEGRGYVVEVFDTSTDDVPDHRAVIFTVDRLGRHTRRAEAYGWTRTAAIQAAMQRLALNAPEEEA